MNYFLFFKSINSIYEILTVFFQVNKNISSSIMSDMPMLPYILYFGFIYNPLADFINLQICSHENFIHCTHIQDLLELTQFKLHLQRNGKNDCIISPI